MLRNNTNILRKIRKIISANAEPMAQEADEVAQQEATFIPGMVAESPSPSKGQANAQISAS